MQGVTIAIVGFIFVCMAMPHLVKHKAQFYVAFVAVILIIGLDAMAHMFATEIDGPGAFSKFLYVSTAFLQVVALIMMVLSVGGLTAGQLAGELAGAYEVIRRGGEEKEIIIPPHARPPAEVMARAAAKKEEPAPQVFHLDEAGNEISPEQAKKDKEDPESGIPLV